MWDVSARDGEQWSSPQGPEWAGAPWASQFLWGGSSAPWWAWELSKGAFFGKKYSFVYLGAFGLWCCGFYLQQGGGVEERDVCWGWRGLGCRNWLSAAGKVTRCSPGCPGMASCFSLSSFRGRLQPVWKRVFIDTHFLLLCRAQVSELKCHAGVGAARAPHAVPLSPGGAEPAPRLWGWSLCWQSVS